MTAVTFNVIPTRLIEERLFSTVAAIFAVGPAAAEYTVEDEFVSRYSLPAFWTWNHGSTSFAGQSLNLSDQSFLFLS